MLKTKKLRIVSGLILYWPNASIKRNGNLNVAFNVCNYPIQSFATADIVPVGLVYTWHLLRVMEMQSFLINTVHDSIVAEVAPDEKEEYNELANYAMLACTDKYLRDVYGQELFVPLEVEAEVASNWTDSEDWRKEYLTE